MDSSTSPTLDEPREPERLSGRIREAEKALSDLPELPIGAGDELEIAGELGEGAMGRVLLADQRSLRRKVAVKTLRDGAVTPFTLRGLVTEGVIMGQLEHPNIVPVHQLGVDDRGLPALVMKQISGVSWRDLLRTGRHPMLSRFGRGEVDPLDAHVEILMHVCDALEYAHRRGIVHRDVKVENVMVGEHGEVYLVDWGLALSIVEGDRPRRIVGTPGYMAPEMVTGEPIDPRTDVFLLGSTLHYVLTGKVRHEGKSASELLANAARPSRFAYDPDVPSELAELANRATSASPEDRPESAESFRKALVLWRQHRASHLLRREATVRLARLEGLHAAGGLDPATFMRLSSECRFGFTQALREWPENPDAKIGLRECLKLMVTWAIQHEDATSARALLPEISPPSATLEATLQTLEERLAAKRARAKKGEEIFREQDLAVGGADRLRLLLAVAAALTLVRLGLIAVRGTEDASRPSTLLAVGGFALAIVAAGTWHGRRELFRNTISRQIVGMVLVMLSGIFLNRLHGWATDAHGESLMAVDSLIAALTGALAALTVRKELWSVAAVSMLGAFVSTKWPEAAAYSFSIASVGGLALLAFVLERYKHAH